MKFRKRPVEIEARQLLFSGRNDVSDILHWCGGRLVPGGIELATAEGVHLAQDGDWIIKGLLGFYPMRPDIFEATYEPVDQTGAS